MGIAASGGKILLKDSAVGIGQDCCCAPVCTYACYCHPGAGGSGWVVQDTPCSVAGLNCCTLGFSYGSCVTSVIATTTINKPLVFSGAPVLVTITGFADDDIAIDGEIVGPLCRLAGSVSYVFLMEAGDPSFELSIVDNWQACASAQLTICFSSCPVFAQPTLTVEGGSGTGATFTPTLSQSNANSLWRIESVTVSGGTGYVDGESLTIAIAAGDTEAMAATAVVRTKRSAPTLTLQGNATATISVAENTEWFSLGTWKITSVAVTNGGSGYYEGQQLGVTGGTEVIPVGMLARTQRVQPDVTMRVDNGSGASLTPVLSQDTDGNGRAVWRITSITINNPGTGYSVGSNVFASAPSGGWLMGNVSSIDANGGITGISQVWYDIFYWATSDSLESVYIYNGGAYFAGSSEPGTVTVTSGGLYYRCEENPFP